MSFLAEADLIANVTLGCFMTITVDFRTVQLLCSRMCHDLVGPVGAINTAIELMGEEGGGAMDTEALKVLAKSASEASRKLAFFRAVFGLGGDRDTSVETSQLLDLANGIVASRKISIQWDPAIPSTVSGGIGKILMLQVFLSADALPRGGSIGVRVQAFTDGIAVACIAEGNGAVLHPEVEGVLAGITPQAELTARAVPSYVLALLAAENSAAVQFSTPQPGQVALAVLFSNGLSG